MTTIILSLQQIELLKFSLNPDYKAAVYKKARELYGTNQKASRALISLVKQGLMKRKERGIYSLTNEGVKVISEIISY